MRVTFPAAGSLLILLVACEKPKVPVPVADLHPAADTVLLASTEPPAGAWLGGNRWLVVTPNERKVTVVDMGRRTAAPLGGLKSSAYRNPFGLFRAGDSAYVNDWGLARASVWTLEGTLAGTLPASAALRGALPRARDAAGQFYYEITPAPGPDGSGYRDSAAVVRSTPDLARYDTVARLGPPDLATVSGQGGAHFERRALSGSDRWGVLPDGTLWVARVIGNRLEWIAPNGSRTKGEGLPDPVLPVSAEDREMFYRQFPPELRSNAEKIEFTLVHPPFVAAMTAPDGRVWLEKSRTFGDSLQAWQLISRTGTLTQVFRIRGEGHLLALAPDLALVAEPSTDGYRLLTYRIPQ
jgi:hypothetical protein